MSMGRWWNRQSCEFAVALFFLLFSCFEFDLGGEWGTLLKNVESHVRDEC